MDTINAESPSLILVMKSIVCSLVNILYITVADLLVFRPLCLLSVFIFSILTVIFFMTLYIVLAKIKYYIEQNHKNLLISVEYIMYFINRSNELNKLSFITIVIIIIK